MYKVANAYTNHTFITNVNYQTANHYFNAIAKRKQPNSIYLMDLETGEILKTK